MGSEEWLLRLVDDAAFSMSPVSETEPDQYNTANLVATLADWDNVDEIYGDAGCRLRGLLEVAKELKTTQCIALLERELSECSLRVVEDTFVEKITGVNGRGLLTVLTSSGEGTMNFPNESGVTRVYLDDDEVRIKLSTEQQELVDRFKR